jgi:twitching motility protein PilU
VAGVGRFRVSCFYQRNQVGMVLRRIETRIPTVEELNLPPIIKTLAMTKRGIIIFVGATGTGKSTSLAAMIGYRNQNSTGHIITIEDPIEFVHKHEGCIITQREVGIDTDSWENALKNTLRQAPDVIMIGEVRTREGMDHAIAFAETGHLVLCTLHANNANQAMDRIINFFPEDRRSQLLMDLSLNLKGVVAQQLIPTPDGKGRRVAMEILLGTPLVQDYIRDGEIHKLKEVMKESTNLGMKTFDQSLFELYQAGEISYEDALRYADSQNEVRLRIKLAQGGDARTLAQGLDGVEIAEPGAGRGRTGLRGLGCRSTGAGAGRRQLADGADPPRRPVRSATASTLAGRGWQHWRGPGQRGWPQRSRVSASGDGGPAIRPDGTVLGFDVGARRIGVAIGSAFGSGARPVAVVDVRDGAPDWPRIDQLVREWRPDGVVVGDPMTLDGGDQPIRKAARAFARDLRERTRLPVVMIDERNSSIEAAQRFADARAGGRKRRRDADALDAMAAAIIVERWLAAPQDAVAVA